MLSKLFQAATLLSASLVPLVAGEQKSGFLEEFSWPAEPELPSDSALSGACPDDCSKSGGAASEAWPLYVDLANLGRCSKTQLFSLGLRIPLEGGDIVPYKACTAGGSYAAKGDLCGKDAPLKNGTGDVKILSWNAPEAQQGASVAEVADATKQLKAALEADPACDDTILFAKSGAAVVGLFVGSEVRKTSAAPLVEKFIGALDMLKSTGPRVAAELCGPVGERPVSYMFGLYVDTHGNVTNVQEALRSWSDAQCLQGADATADTWKGVNLEYIPGKTLDIKLLKEQAAAEAKGPANSNSTFSAMSTSAASDETTRIPAKAATDDTSSSKNPAKAALAMLRRSSPFLTKRADCRAIKVEKDNNCDSLAAKCGIKVDDFYKYLGGKDKCSNLKIGQKVCCSTGTVPVLQPNPDGTCQYVQVPKGGSCWALANEQCPDILTQKELNELNGKTDDKWCDTLKEKEPICCSKGKKPDLRPQKKPDGSCFPYQIPKGGYCQAIASEFLLELTDFDKFNKGKTWGWQGCETGKLLPDQWICLSDGDPPFPNEVGNAQCGPQKPGSGTPGGPTGGKKLADMNPCPINACCNKWGQCGLDGDFCIDTTVDGTPGTAKNGTHGCISNCGMEIVNNDKPPASFTRVAYFEAWNKERRCLHMDVDQIKSPYTHIHFAFGNINQDLSIDVKKTQAQFDKFKKITGLKKIISFGGWAFSNDAATSGRFRLATSPANRATFANNVAKFIKDNGLDGVDFDWEYPGAQDIEGSEPGNDQDGPNYLKFLQQLRTLIPDKSLSIAAPAGYWYLRHFPIKQIATVVDYIIYMTYDLHGQWDVNNKWVSPGCLDGNCLRSHVNKTETKASLVLITKAGVPSYKVMVGVTSYGRSFKMASKGCKGPQCKFLGERNKSPAAPGYCTREPGYIADAEIRKIMAVADSGGGGSYEMYHDDDSDSDIIIYNGDEWVGWMDRDLKNKRTDWYKGLNFGGTTDWAVDLQVDGSDLDGGSSGNGPNDFKAMDLDCDYNRKFASLDDLEKAAGEGFPDCMTVWTLNVLKNELRHSLDGFDDAAKGYDGLFDTYEKFIRDGLDSRLVTFMKENGKGTKFFKCYKKRTRDDNRDGATEADCNDRDWPSWETWTYWFDLKDKEGNEKALMEDGIDPEWVKLGVHTENRQATPPCGNFCYNDDLIHRGFPVRGDKVEVPDPQDVVLKAKENFDVLEAEYDLQGALVQLQAYTGDLDDLIDSLMLPITMLRDAISSMIEVKRIANEINEENKKNLILKIVEGILFLIPFVGAAVGRLGAMGARLARLLRGLEGFGDTALTTYTIIQDPTMAPIAVMSMIVGNTGSPKKYGDVAKAKRGMTSKQQDDMGPSFKALNPKVNNIIKKGCGGKDR